MNNGWQSTQSVKNYKIQGIAFGYKRIKKIQTECFINKHGPDLYEH